jgi:hypothetical protein
LFSEHDYLDGDNVHCMPGNETRGVLKNSYQKDIATQTVRDAYLLSSQLGKIHHWPKA